MILTLFVSIKSFRAEQALDFVIISTRLVFPLIQYTLAISLLSYD
jgi:hypothetical protein